jgi:hypothetical protein
MIHPDTKVEYINDTIGYGLVATKFIPRGTITWVLDELDAVYSPEKVSSLSPLLQKQLDIYAFRNAAGEKILCWDNAKFVNHSFYPTCFSTAYDLEIAIRDIHPGEQLTDDYGYLNVETPFFPVDEGHVRKAVYPNDLLNFHEEWDELIKNNLPFVFSQEQPLLPYVDTDLWNDFKKLEKDPSQMQSLLSCHHYNKIAV